MRYIHTLRNGFPDLKFFGNTFVALSLASSIENSMLIAKKKKGFSDEAGWSQAAHDNLGARLIYSPYTPQSSASGPSLSKVVADELRKDDSGVTVNFHYAETDLNEDICSQLPKEYGDNVAQFMHLHCSPDFFLSKSKTREERKDNLIRAYEKGWIKKYIPVSYLVRDAFLDYLPREAMEVAQNGISEDIYKFRSEMDRDAFKGQFDINGRFIIGYSGRLDSVKGYDDLIAVLHWFNERPEYDVGFLIASPGGARLGTFEKDVKKRAGRLTQENRIGLTLDVAKLVGETKKLNRFAYDYFQNFVQDQLQPKCGLYQDISPSPLQVMVDVYIQPSRSEGLPLSVIEAVFTGTPVVAYRVGGLSEIISDTQGKLIDHHPKMRVRLDDFCEAIAHIIDQNYGLLGDKDTTDFRKEVRSRLIPTFGAKAMALRMLEIYSDNVNKTS